MQDINDRAEQARQDIRDLVNHLQDDGFEVVGIVGLLSGGNDSTTTCHVVLPELTHLAHCNTGIGIEQTRQFVRDQATAWSLPLMEVHPPEYARYEKIVCEHGFPGPAHHFKMFNFLKERGMRQVRKALVSNGRKQRVVFVSGIRNAESARRSTRPKYSRDGSMQYIAPLIDWTNEDLNRYRELHNVPHNEVADMIHMSGECLCGAFAGKGELEEIGFFFPETAEYIRSLELKVQEAGIPEPRCYWGWGAYKNDPDGLPPSRTGMLCSSCELRADHLVQ